MSNAMMTSLWFILGNPEPVTITHRLSQVPEGSSKEELRQVLRLQAPQGPDVLANQRFDDVVEYAWAVFCQDRDAIRAAKRKELEHRRSKKSTRFEKNKGRKV